MQGAFDLDGKFPPVPENVKLWKGLFSDSLPGFIKEMDAKDPNGKFMINYLHVDCDLYVGANCFEALHLTAHPRGTVEDLKGLHKFAAQNIKCPPHVCRRKGRLYDVGGSHSPWRHCGL